jgi:hypothetical protein
MGTPGVEQPTTAVDSESVWFAELIWKARVALDRIVPANPVPRVSVAFFSLWAVGCVIAYTSPTIGSRTSRAGNTLRINQAHGHVLAAALQSLIVTGLLSLIALMIYAVMSDDSRT